MHTHHTSQRHPRYNARLAAAHKARNLALWALRSLRNDYGHEVHLIALANYEAAVREYRAARHAAGPNARFD